MKEDVRKRHRPFERLVAKSDTLVLFVHGFLGSPDQFREYADVLFEKGISSAAVLLPGHGSDGRAFAKARLDDWQKHVDKAVDHYRDKYPNLILFGHSMGGLLAARASLGREDSVKGLFLLASPLQMKVTARAVKRVLCVKFGSKKLDDDEITGTYRKTNSVYPVSIFTYPLWLRQTKDLKRLILATKEILPFVAVPTVSVHSKGDETVSFESSRLFEEGLSGTSCTTVILERSHHAHYFPEEGEVIQEELLKMIDTLK